MKNIYCILIFFSYFSTLTHAQCNTEIGNLPSDTLFICENGVEIIPHESYILDENDALIYLLHTENGLEQAIDTFSSNEIAWQELGVINWNTMYFVSAIAGADVNMDGLPDDLNGECTLVSNAMPVIFAASVGLTLLSDCSTDFFSDSLCSFVTSSVLHIDDEINHITDDVDRVYTIYNNLDLDTITTSLPVEFPYTLLAGDFAVFKITDNFGCIDTTVIFNNDDCLPIIDGLAIITNMPLQRQDICDGDTSQVYAGCIATDFNSTVEYVLSTSPLYDEDSIIATNSNGGIFSALDAQGFESQELYVIGTVTNSFFGNTGYTEEPTPIVFLKPTKLAIHVLDCNSETGMATLEITPIGGLPEFDTDAFYNIEGDIETSLQFGESQVIEVPLSAGMEWELNLTISDASECQELIATGEMCVVNIENQNTSNSYLQNLFPNPTNNLLHLQIRLNQNQPFSLQLWDMKGNMIFQESKHFSTGLQELTLELGHLPAGVYYLRIVGKEGVDFRKVMVL